MRTVLCKDAHKMHAAADAGGDENVWQTCATVAQAAVLVRAATGCTAVANCRCECTGCRTVCTGRCKTDGKLKPTRESHCVVGLHGVRHGAVQGCAADALGCRFRQRERKVHVRTSELRRVLVATEGHGIVAMHAWTDIGVMGVSEAAQGPRAMRWDAFRFGRLLVIRPESTPSRS